MSLAVVILAAGQGTRMVSRIPKVLHTLCGRSMLQWVIQSARALRPVTITVVLGHQAAEVQTVLDSDIEVVTQTPRLGTAHALSQAMPRLLGRCQEIIVMYGDMPLIQPNILSALHAARGRCPAALLTVRSRQIAGFGRVIRSADGRVQAIIEEKECTTEQLQIDELNGGIYCFDTTWIEQALPKLAPHGDGEYYLTDVAEYAARLGNPVATWLASDPDEVWGVNNREQLATANGILRQRIAQRLMLSGVTIMDPAAAYIDDTVQIGIDTIIYPNTTIVGNTRIGENCHIGPNAYLRDSSIGNACRVNASIVEDSKMDDGSSLGPFSHIRDGAHLSSGVYLGNYAEVKNASLGQGTLMHHFGYVGDATVGKEVNIAAGVVTCNFNSETREKSHTQIGDRAAVGSDTMLIAPLTVGEGAITAAGSVVTHDVDNGTLVAGVPARPVRRVQPLLAGTDERESKE